MSANALRCAPKPTRPTLHLCFTCGALDIQQLDTGHTCSPGLPGLRECAQGSGAFSSFPWVCSGQHPSLVMSIAGEAEGVRSQKSSASTPWHLQPFGEVKPPDAVRTFPRTNPTSNPLFLCTKCSLAHLAARLLWEQAKVYEELLALLATQESCLARK